MTRPSLRVTSVTIGTAEPRDLAQFYADLLGRPVTAEDPPDPGDPAKGGWAQNRPPDGEPGPTLNFEYEQHFARPVWPSVRGEQTASQHLDIWVVDPDESVEWAVAHGATLAEFQPQEDVRVLFDPAGHPFCLFL
jgi:catechol 2,3-dioxygenase-like lactoylglutathione lyase family enzyme